MYRIRNHSLPAALLVLLLAVSGCSGGRSPADEAKKAADLTEAALNAGTPEVALHLTDAMLEKNPGDADALSQRGEALTQLGRLDEARATLRKAVASQPRNVRALLALGRVLLPVNPAEAEVDFESALKQDGRNAAAMNNLGIARDLQGHHADAEAAYRSAISIQPDMTAAQVNLALCLAIRGRGGDAIRLMQPLADAPDATLKIKEDYAAVLALSGERQEAERILSANMSASEVASALDVLTLARAAPLPDTHVAAPITAAPQPLALAPAARETDTTEHQAVVQLGALNSEEAAHDKWQQLSKRYPDLLNGRQPVFSRTERNGQAFWRVRTSGFQDVAQAQGFCDRMRTAGGGCTVFD
jgi:Flp pilus assembly protein TadD